MPSARAASISACASSDISRRTRSATGAAGIGSLVMPVLSPHGGRHKLRWPWQGKVAAQSRTGAAPRTDAREHGPGYGAGAATRLREGSAKMAAEPQWRCVTPTQSRRPIVAVALLIIAGQTWVSHSLALRPVWVFPAIATVLLVASIAVYESRAEPGRAARALSYAFVMVLVAANAASLALLVHGVFVGSGLGPAGLLAAGVALWLVNVAVFALLYWEVDGGGPESRAGGYEGRYPDLVFPQQQSRPAGHRAADLEAELLRLPLRLAHRRDRLLAHRRDAVHQEGQARDGRREPAGLRHPRRGRRARRQHRPRLTGAPLSGKVLPLAVARRLAGGDLFARRIVFLDASSVV